MNSNNQQRGHLSVADAQAEVLRHADRRTVETVTLERALGRVLVEDIRSNRDQPPYDVSAMDGFAVRAADLATAPTALTVIEDIQAGDMPKQTVGAGQRVHLGGLAAIQVQPRRLGDRHALRAPCPARGCTKLGYVGNR